MNHIDRISLSLFLSSLFYSWNAGASLNPAPDNTRGNTFGSNSNGNNYSPGSPYNPGNPSGNVYGGQHVDPNQVFGNPNRQPQSNQPWNNLPIFPPNPTSGQASSGHQQPVYPASPQNPYPYQFNQGNLPGGFNPHTDVFGHPPPGLVPSYQNIYPPRGTTRTPSLLDQFLNGPSGRRRSSSSTTLQTSGRHASFIVILSICNILVGYILTARH